MLADKSALLARPKKSDSKSNAPFAPMSDLAVEDLAAFAGGDRFETSVSAIEGEPRLRLVLLIARGEREEAKRMLGDLPSDQLDHAKSWIASAAGARSTERPDGPPDVGPSSKDPVRDLFGPSLVKRAEPAGEGAFKVRLEIDLSSEDDVLWAFDSDDLVRPDSRGYKMPKGGPDGEGPLLLRGTWKGDLDLTVVFRSDRCLFGAVYGMDGQDGTLAGAFPREPGDPPCLQFGELRRGEPGEVMEAKDLRRMGSGDLELRLTITGASHRLRLRGQDQYEVTRDAPAPTGSIGFMGGPDDAWMKRITIEGTLVLGR